MTIFHKIKYNLPEIPLQPDLAKLPKELLILIWNNLYKNGFNHNTHDDLPDSNHELAMRIYWTKYGIELEEYLKITHDSVIEYDGDL